MTLAIATMPDNPLDRPRWLDEQLVGGRLGDLVDEWMALRGSESPEAPLDQLLGGYRADLLARGTAALPESIRRQLLRSPAYLLDLQELVLLEGGPYWDALPRPPQLSAIAERSRAAILAELPAPLAWQPGSAPAKSRSRVLPWIISFAVAASVLAAVWAAGWWPRPTPAPAPGNAVAWGWAKPEALPQAASADEYYVALAAAGQQWFAKRPDDRAGLAKRLNELRQGCSVLIVSDHPPLSAEQAQELKERCRKWAAQFDAALVKLEAGADPLEVRTDVDAVVTKLVDYLNSQRTS